MPRGRPRKDNAAPADQPTKPAKGNAAPLGIGAQLFLAADKLRKNLETSGHKHVALGLIFLKHISIAFESRRATLLAEDPTAAEDSDEYTAENVFWVPKEARWSHLQDSARQPAIGKIIDDAMAAIEAHNPGLKGVLPKDYNRPALDKVIRTHIRIGGLACVMLEPGTRISHMAVVLAARAGTLLIWVGEAGVRLYAAGQPGGARADRLLLQARLALDEDARLRVVRTRCPTRSSSATAARPRHGGVDLRDGCG